MSAPTSPRDIVPKTPANTPTNKTVLDFSLIMVGVSPDFMAENKNDDNYCKKKKENYRNLGGKYFKQRFTQVFEYTERTIELSFISGTRISLLNKNKVLVPFNRPSLPRPSLLPPNFLALFFSRTSSLGVKIPSYQACAQKWDRE